MPRPAGLSLRRALLGRGDALDPGRQPGDDAELRQRAVLVDLELVDGSAAGLGAKQPRRFPTWLARLLAGEAVTVMSTEARGASNAKAEQKLGWTPRYEIWRTGFFTVYVSRPPADGRASQPATAERRVTA